MDRIGRFFSKIFKVLKALLALVIVVLIVIALGPILSAIAGFVSAGISTLIGVGGSIISGLISFVGWTGKMLLTGVKALWGYGATAIKWLKGNKEEVKSFVSWAGKQLNRSGVSAGLAGAGLLYLLSNPTVQKIAKGVGFFLLAALAVQSRSRSSRS